MKRLAVITFLVLAAVGSFLTGCAGLLDFTGDNTRATAAAEADKARELARAEAYRLDQQRAAQEAEAARYNQQQGALQAQETARLAYQNADAQARREFYSYLVAARAMTPEEAARVLFGEKPGGLAGLLAGVPSWALIVAGLALGAAAVMYADVRRSARRGKPALIMPTGDRDHDRA